MTAARFEGVAQPSLSQVIGRTAARTRTGESLTYSCDPHGHRIVVTDENGRIRFAFGAYGNRPGQFDTPIDIACVVPEFDGEDVDAGTDEVWIAVADYGNKRVQVFELDGVLVGTVEEIEDTARTKPCRLTWRAPVLDIESVEGRRHRVHLAAALLCHSSKMAAAALRDRARRERAH